MNVLHERPTVTYDRGSDVLYIRLGEPVHCESHEDPAIDGLVFRYAFTNHSLRGVTIVWYSEQDKEALRRKIPFPVDLP